MQRHQRRQRRGSVGQQRRAPRRLQQGRGAGELRKRGNGRAAYGLFDAAGHQQLDAAAQGRCAFGIPVTVGEHFLNLAERADTGQDGHGDHRITFRVRGPRRPVKIGSPGQQPAMGEHGSGDSERAATLGCVVVVQRLVRQPQRVIKSAAACGGVGPGGEQGRCLRSGCGGGGEKLVGQFGCRAERLVARGEQRAGHVRAASARLQQGPADGQHRAAATYLQVG